MQRIIIAGIGTNVGKTVVAAVVATALGADYWKPIETGESASDSARIQKLLMNTVHVLPPAISLKAPLSPHEAARLEGYAVDVDRVKPPESEKVLVIEGIGGVLVPLTATISTLDLFSRWNSVWIVVSRHYLGSINHTLLTCTELQRRSIPILGVIFNGNDTYGAEEAVLQIAKVPLIGKLLPEKKINKNVIERYSQEWQERLHALL